MNHLVSIHAPARGATRIFFFTFISFRCFNPRPCARGDLPCQWAHQSMLRFNPRPCARGDILRHKSQEREEFQSTPLREGRLTFML